MPRLPRNLSKNLLLRPKNEGSYPLPTQHQKLQLRIEKSIYCTHSCILRAYHGQVAMQNHCTFYPQPYTESMPLKPQILRCSECGSRVKIKTNNPMLHHTDRQKRNTFVLCRTHWNKLSPLQQEDHKRDFPVYLTN